MQAAHVMHALMFALINDAGSACDARISVRFDQ